MNLSRLGTGFLTLLLTAMATSASAAEEGVWDDPVEDPALERRLERQATFVTRPGDTLGGLGRLLYGHRTWWVRLRAINRPLAALGPEAPIAPGTHLIYRAPRVGDPYRVRPGDWLARVAIWRFGSVEGWRATEDSGDLRPGDLLSFEEGRAVRNLRTGGVVLARADAAEAHEEALIPEPPPVPEAQPPPPELFEEARILASLSNGDRAPFSWALRHARAALWAAAVSALAVGLSLIGLVARGVFPFAARRPGSEPVPSQKASSAMLGPWATLASWKTPTESSWRKASPLISSPSCSASLSSP
ncbi:MAG: hypothetical protein IT285_08120 [Bdellovibrionales bacterium]|nr:hypothetical protein [Bdellovibrionales bacterium]